MKSPLLKHHQTTSFSKLASLEESLNARTSFFNIDINLPIALYLVSYRIVKEGKSHRVGETALLPAAVYGIKSWGKRQPKKYKQFNFKHKY